MRRGLQIIHAYYYSQSSISNRYNKASMTCKALHTDAFMMARQSSAISVTRYNGETKSITILDKTRSHVKLVCSKFSLQITLSDKTKQCSYTIRFRNRLWTLLMINKIT